MYSTNDFHHNARYRIFSTTKDHLNDFNIPFDETSRGTTLELQSSRTNEVSTWSVESITYLRNDTPKCLKLVPTIASLDKFPGLQGYKMLIYVRGYTKKGQQI